MTYGGLNQNTVTRSVCVCVCVYVPSCSCIKQSMKNISDGTGHCWVKMMSQKTVGDQDRGHGPIRRVTNSQNDGFEIQLLLKWRVALTPQVVFSYGAVAGIVAIDSVYPSRETS